MNNDPYVPEPVHHVPDMPDDLLQAILSTRRAHGSVGDTNFRMWLQNTIKELGVPFDVGPVGNIVATAKSEVASKTLFSCHIDTCHSKAESNGQSQKLMYDSVMGHLYLDPISKAGCLGADDGAGIYIMLKMLANNIPGTYVFHTGEECGGIGANAMLEQRTPWLKQFDRAIAFDRPNNNEVIITQGGRECASIEAGEDLVAMLNECGLDFKTSTRGVFTDTKVYAGVIPECFNLGVGYYSQHNPKETLDVAHLEALLNACLVINWENLLTVRKPIPMITPKKFYDSMDNTFDRKIKDAWINPMGSFDKPKTVAPIKFVSLLNELATYDLDELRTICEDTPDNAACIIARLFAKVNGLQAEVDTLHATLGVA
jgi:hypothetical protein